MRLFRELMMKDVRLSGWRGVLCCAVVLRALSGTGRPAASSELGPAVIRSLALLAKSLPGLEPAQPPLLLPE